MNTPNVAALDGTKLASSEAIASSILPAGQNRLSRCGLTWNHSSVSQRVLFEQSAGGDPGTFHDNAAFQRAFATFFEVDCSLEDRQMGDDALFIDDPLGAYLFAVRQVPAMDQAEEIACIEHVKARDDMSKVARKRLIEANLGLVVSLAERHRDERINILDLIQKGNEGLLHATENLTDCLPGSFSTHATIFVERALIEAGKTDPTKR